MVKFQPTFFGVDPPGTSEPLTSQGVTLLTLSVNIPLTWMLIGGILTECNIFLKKV